MKHINHKKSRLYIRSQSKKSKQWQSIKLWLCECGVILKVREKLLEVKIEEVKSL